MFSPFCFEAMLALCSFISISKQPLPELFPARGPQAFLHPHQIAFIETLNFKETKRQAPKQGQGCPLDSSGPGKWVVVAPLT